MERKQIELYPSLSLLTLAGYLRAQGIPVGIEDLTFARDLEPLARRLRAMAPAVVGVHTKTLTTARAGEIARLARSYGALPIAGGPDSASRPELYLRAGFEAVVLGEGELTLVDLLGQYTPTGFASSVPGAVVRTPAGGTDRGPPRPYLSDLDALPLPAWELVDMEGYLRRWEARTGERRAAILTSRGCPFDCSWCSKPTFGRSFRQQSVPRVLDELSALAERYRVDYVRFCDDVFGIQRRWVEALTEGMAARGLRLRFECLARVDLLKPELLPRLRAAGLARVYLGVESGSQRMLDRMNRGTRLEQIARLSAALKAHQIRQFWFLMLGYPGETLSDLEATVRLFRRFSPEEYSVSLAVPVPGTRLFETVRDRLRRGGRIPGRIGGRTLTYDASYPEALYRWEQARIAWEAQVHRLRGHLSERLLTGLTRAVDRFHSEVATPLLTGATEPPVGASWSTAPGDPPGPPPR